MKARLLHFRDFLMEYAGTYLILLMITCACVAVGYWLVKSFVLGFGIPISDEQVWSLSLVATIGFVATIAKVAR